MCGSTKAPQVVQQDPVAEQAAADAKAAQSANSSLSLRRQQLAQNSLLTRGARGTDPGVNTPYNLLSTAVKPKAVQPSQGTTGGSNPRRDAFMTIGNVIRG